MWLGRYGRQNAVDIAERMPMVDVTNWMLILDEMLKKEGAK